MFTNTLYFINLEFILICLLVFRSYKIKTLSYWNVFAIGRALDLKYNDKIFCYIWKHFVLILYDKEYIASS